MSRYIHWPALPGKEWRGVAAVWPRRRHKEKKPPRARPQNSPPLSTHKKKHAHIKTEAVIGLSHVYASYELALEPGQDPLPLRATITMSPKDGVKVKVVARKGVGAAGGGGGGATAEE